MPSSSPFPPERRAGAFTLLASCGSQSQHWGPLPHWVKCSLHLSVCPGGDLSQELRDVSEDHCLREENASSAALGFAFGLLGSSSASSKNSFLHCGVIIIFLLFFPGASGRKSGDQGRKPYSDDFHINRSYLLTYAQSVIMQRGVSLAMTLLRESLGMNLKLAPAVV